MSKWKSGAALLTLMWPPVPALGDGYNFMSEVSSSFFDPANWIPLLDGSPKVPGESDTALLSDSAEIISSEPGNLTVSKISFGSSSNPVELTIDTNDNFTLTTEFSTRNANRGGIINLRKGKIISDRVDLQISQLFNDDKENIIRGVLNLWEGSSTGQFSAKGDELEFRGDSSDINFRADSNINFVDYRTGSGFKFTGSAFDINQIGAGETTLPFKDSSFSGDINVLNGALRISGDLSLGGDVNLFSDATLSGNISVENINLSDGTLITGGDLVVWEDINLQPDAMLSGNIGISGSVRVASGDINIFTDLSDSLRFDGDFVLDQGGINVFAGFPVLAGTYELTDGDLNIAAGSDPMTTGVRLDFEDGSLVTIDGAVRVGSLGANAILALQDDTQMVADSASIGEFQNSTADVLVTGLYSTLSLRGSNDPDQSPLQLGRRGQGALQMVNGGRVYVRGNPDIPLRFATDPTGEANIQVRGNVSRFETDSDVELSFDGTGELLLENSGVFEIRRGNGDLTLAGNTGSATLNIGNNSPAGRLNAENVTSSESGTGVINFNHINDLFAFYQSPGVGINISGGISVNQLGPGSTILDGQLDYTGPTVITDGRLIIDGALTRSAVSVESGGTLGGIGQLSAPVQVADGGRVSPGMFAGTLTMGELALSEYSQLDYDLGLPDGTPGARNDRISVINNLNVSGSSGDLILDGILNVTDNGGFTEPSNFTSPGRYRLFTYDGSLIDNGIVFGGVAAGFNYGIVSGGGVVDLEVDYTGLHFWDGEGTSANGAVNGGAGVWNNTATNWTSESGSLNTEWQALTAVFGGAGTEIEVDGTLTVSGVHVQSDGYRLADRDGNGRLILDSETGAEFRVNRGVVAELDVDVAGSDALIKNGAGALRLLRPLGHTGGTVIAAGTLMADADMLHGTIENHSVLAINQDVDGELQADLLGAGVVDKTGTGALNIADTRFQAGSLNLLGGGAYINSDRFDAGRVNVGAGTFLAGSGRLWDVRLQGGSLAPGNSIGTLTVENLSGSGTYEVEVNSNGASDKLIVSDTARLSDIQLSVLPEPGDYGVLSRYTILEAGTVEGEFSSAGIDVPDFAFLNADVLYEADKVDLILFRNDAELTDIVRSPAQKSTADSLSRALKDQKLEQLARQLLMLSATDAESAVRSLSGSQLAYGNQFALNSGLRLASLVSDRVAGVAASPRHTGTFVDAGGFQALERLQSGDVSALNELPATAAAGQQPNGSGFWLTPQAGFGQVDGTADVIGTEYDFGGVAGGYDHWLSPALLWGAGLSYGALSADEIDVESTDLSVYGRWLFNDQGYVTASVFAGVHESDSRRVVNVGTDRSVARADFGADTRGAYLESGYELDAWSAGQLTPFVGLNYAHLHREGFSERGAGQANLQLEADTQESIRTLVGLKAHHSFASGKAREWSADAQLAWVRELADGQSSLGAAFTAAPEFGFQVAGPEFDRSRAKVGLGLSTDLSARSSLRVGYQGEIAESDQYHSALATLSLRW